MSFLDSQTTAGLFPPPTESDESYNPAIHGDYGLTASYAQEPPQIICGDDGTITPATAATDGEQPKDLQKCKDCGRRYPAKDFLYKRDRTKQAITCDKCRLKRRNIGMMFIQQNFSIDNIFSGYETEVL